MFSRSELALIKWRSMRRKVWFGGLDRVERAIINLTIECIERVRSIKLERIISTIVNKLTDAMKSALEKLTEDIGRPLAQKLSRIAWNWGNKSAVQWAEDHVFIQYLTVMQMGVLRIFKTQAFHVWRCKIGQ